MRNNKKKIALFVAVSVLGITTASFAAITYGVKNTVHNIGSTSIASTKTDETSEICVFCHTPHNSKAGQKFIWNRNNPDTATFMLYTASPTLNFAKGVTISEVSKMCMSCHDGATAMNSMANPRGITFATRIGDAWPDAFCDPATDPSCWGPNIGEYNIETSTGGGNLTNDHPISFSYNQARLNEGATTTLVTETGDLIGDLPLWNGKVECVTCHDPHIDYGDSNGTKQAGGSNPTGNPALTPFLRKSNASSNLCFTCHNK